MVDECVDIGIQPAIPRQQSESDEGHHQAQADQQERLVAQIAAHPRFAVALVITTSRGVVSLRGTA